MPWPENNLPLSFTNEWSAVRLEGKSVWRKKVCVNVSGLLVEIGSPGLDEIRRVPVLRTPRPLEGLISKQVSGTPF
jgi:hypothetical protein